MKGGVRLTVFLSNIGPFNYTIEDNTWSSLAAMIRVDLATHGYNGRFKFVVTTDDGEEIVHQNSTDQIPTNITNILCTISMDYTICMLIDGVPTEIEPLNDMYYEDDTNYRQIIEEIKRKLAFGKENFSLFVVHEDLSNETITLNTPSKENQVRNRDTIILVTKEIDTIANAFRTQESEGAKMIKRLTTQHAYTGNFKGGKRTRKYKRRFK